MAVRSIMQNDLLMGIILTDVLAAIREHGATHALSPTVREIAAAVGLSLSTVHRALQELDERGEIELLPETARGIRLPSADLSRACARLLTLAKDFELAAAHQAEFVVDEEEWLGLDKPFQWDAEGIALDPVVSHAIRCALFRGYALGIRRAVVDGS